MESLGIIQIAYSAAVVLGAFVVRGISGFGAGLVAIPLLALAVPLNICVPALALLNLIASVGQCIKERALIVWREVLLIAPGILVGIVFGMYLFKELDQALLRKSLGIFVVAYAAYSLVAQRVTAASRCAAAWAAPAGMLGGLVDTLFGGGGGPFLVIYLQLRHLAKTSFRATIAIMVVLDVGLRIAAYAAGGFYTKDTLLLSGTALPTMLLGMYVGNHIHRRLSHRTFMRIISVILIGSGTALAVK